jgi:uncharacterized membrane protein YkoI
LNDLPSSIVEKVTNHLRDRVGDDFFGKLRFKYAEIVNFDDMERADPNAKRQWKVYSFKLEYEFARPNVGIKSYEAEIWLDEDGDVIREIDVPPIAHDPAKVKIIPIKEAIAIGKTSGFRASSLGVGYRTEDASIVWILERNNKDGSHSKLEISAHTGAILSSVSYKGIQ